MNIECFKQKHELKGKVQTEQKYLQKLNILQVYLDGGHRISISVQEGNDPFEITDISGDSVLPWLREEKPRVEEKLKQLLDSLEPWVKK